MATEANTVTLSTNFNVAPYYDDFDENKNYHRVLFRPGLGIQGRELTQMQTILQNQIDRFAEHVFKEGSVVRGCEVNYDQRYYYVKVRDNDQYGTNVNISDFVGKTIIGANKNVTAIVLNVADGVEANTPDVKTLFVKYIGANTDGTKYFANAEVLTATSGVTIADNALSVNAISISATGLGSAITVQSGIIFSKDHFIRVPTQTIFLDKYSTAPSYKVGFNVEETIVTDSADSSLLDPAAGTYNYAAPGAARLKLYPRLVKVSRTVTDANTFVQLMDIDRGIVQTSSEKPQYAMIKDYIAQRTADESGNYIVNGLSCGIKEHLKSGTNGGIYVLSEGGNTQFLIVEVQPGKAYVQGYDLEKLVTSRIPVSKSTDSVNATDVNIIADYGNYVIVDNVVGQWDVNAQSTVSLRDTQANAISEIGYSITTAPGSEIGRARVRAIKHHSGTPGLPSAQYRLYLTDINITSSGKGFNNVQSITFSAGVGGANGKADIYGSNGSNAIVSDPSFDYAVYKIPAKAIKTIRDTDGNVNTDFPFNKTFDVSFNTSGVATVSTGAADETFSGSGTLSDTAATERFYVVMRSTGSSNTLTGTVTITSGSNTVSGSGTSFLSQVNPGDIIACDPTDEFLVSSVTNNTTLNLVSAAGASRSANTFHKRFKAGQVIDMSGVGGGGNRSVSISSTTTASVDINESLTTSLNATVVTSVNKSNGQEASKTINRNSLVQVHIGSNRGGSGYTANTTGPWNLGLADGFRLVSVRKKSGSDFSATSEGSDVTSSFTLDTGMRDNKYDHAKLVKKSNASISIASGDRLLVTLDYFTHSYSSGVGYFSVDSYPVNDASPSGSNIATHEIPLFISTVDGISYDLRDSIDIRPRISDTANNVTTLSGIATNPLSSTAFDQPSGGLHFASPGDPFSMDLSYYVKRKDVFVFTKEGKFKVINGTPSLSPASPIAPTDALHLATISIPQYPSLSPEVGRSVNRPDLTVGISPVRNERYTMKDIGVLKDRIDRLEYYTTLTLLEKDSKDLLIQDSSGNDRFKNGILVDSFTGHNIGNVFDSDYKISIDSQKGEARPPFQMDNVELFYKAANSSNVVRTNVTPAGVSRDQVIFVSNSQIRFSNGETVTAGAATGVLTYNVKDTGKLYIEQATGNFSVGATVTGATSGRTATISSVQTVAPGELITLSYNHFSYAAQPYATTTRNATGLFWNWTGKLTLDPDNDYWVDTVSRPDVQINFDGNADNWQVLANAWGTQWGDWQSVVTGQQVVSTRDVVTGVSISSAGGTNKVSESFITEETVDITTKSSRVGTQLTVTPYTTTQNLGSLVKDVNIQPFMRSRVIRVTATGMKPNTRLFAYFDDINVTSFITPTNSSFANTANEGSRLTADSDGNVYALFRLPNQDGLRFRVGSKKFRLTDNPTNNSSLGAVVTAAEGYYTAQGLNTGVQQTSVSTRSATISSGTVKDSKTDTTSSINSKGGGTKVVGEIQQNNITNTTVNTTIVNNEFVTNNVTVNNVTNTTNVTNVTNVTNNISVSGDGGDGGDSDGGSDGDGDDDDPIAQSFIVNTIVRNRGGASGIYLTKLDLFFATKDPSLGVTIEIREIDPAAGGLTKRIVPFGRKLIRSSEVNTSDDGSKPTQVIFSSPIYLENNKEYGFVILPAGNNPNYNVWISRLGEVDLLSGNRVSAQPFSGVLYASSNDRIYNPIQEEDIKFRLYAAAFSTNTTGEVVFKNDDTDYLTVANVSSNFSKIGEIVHGETLIKGAFSNSQIVDTSSWIQGMDSNANGTITTFSASGQLKVKNVSLTAKFRGGENIRIRNSSGTIIGNSSGGITATTPVGRVVHWDALTASNTYLHLANSSYINSGAAFSNNRMFTTNMHIKGQTDGATAAIAVIDNLKIDVMNFNTDHLTPIGTQLLFNGKFATGLSTKDSSFNRINFNDSTYFDASRFILSRSNEANSSYASATIGRDRSYEIKAQLRSSQQTLSPVLDVKRISVTTVENLINSNSAIGSSEDYVSFGGSAKTRYITRKITLADGQDAEDLKVYLSAYKPSGSQVYVYYKVLHAEDGNTFDDCRWIPMSLSTANTVVSDSVNSETFNEYEFNIPTIFVDNNYSGANTTNNNVLEYRNSSRARFVGFKYFAIKVVMTAETSVNPPRMRDIRAIALQR